MLSFCKVSTNHIDREARHKKDRKGVIYIFRLV